MMQRLVLPSVPGSVATAARFVEAAAAEAALPPALAERLLLAAGEAVSNAIEHGNGEDPARLVRLEWAALPDGGVLSVQDEGPGLTREQVLTAELPADPYQTGGRGLFLIRTLSDDVEVEGARLRLVFRLRPGEAP
jgi:anti-sigma regulatory factor (Ser/Thr protein kinase)